MFHLQTIYLTDVLDGWSYSAGGREKTWLYTFPRPSLRSRLAPVILNLTYVHNTRINEITSTVIKWRSPAVAWVCYLSAWMNKNKWINIRAFGAPTFACK